MAKMNLRTDSVHSTKILLWILVLINSSASVDYFTNIAASDLFGAPLIVPSEPDVTVTPGENYKLKCTSKDPITWQPFKSFSGKHDIQESHTQNADQPYEAILELLDIDYMYVGYYYCINKDAADEEDIEEVLLSYRAAKIYLFVEDPEHPLVSVDWPVVTGNQYSEVVIPCKPTSRSVTVKLIKEGDESHQFDSIYNPSTGFTIKLSEVTDGGSYTCRVQNSPDNEVHEEHFDVQVDSGKNYFNRPLIKSKTGNYGTEGDSLVLNCSVESYIGVKYTINWILPNNNIAEAENRVEKSQPKQEPLAHRPGCSIGYSIIKIRDLDRIKDRGSYKCEVVDNLQNRNSHTLQVAILAPNESIIEINEPSDRYKIEISSKMNEARWFVNYNGHPKPKLQWLDNKNNTIPWSEGDDKLGKYYAELKDDSTMLTIRNLDLSDSGDYYLHAYNGEMEKSKKFQLMVKDRPTVRVNNISVQPNQVAELRCEIAGYPKSTVTWSFTPCSATPVWPSCDSARTLTYSDDSSVTEEVTFMSQHSTLRFYPKQPGIVVCRAQNKEGSDEAKAEVLITDLKEDLQLWDTSDEVIAAGDALSVICGASVYKYANEPLLYRNEQPLTESEGVQIISNDTDFSYRKVIIFKSIQQAATGNYECRAKVVEDNSYNYVNWFIDVKEPYAPAIDLTNMNEHAMKLSLGEPLQLECKFRGIPRPAIRWYKDDEEILPEVNDTRIELHENNTQLNIRFIRNVDEGKYRCVGTNRIGTSSQETTLQITNLPTVNKAWIIGIVAIILILIVCTIYLCIRIRRERKLLRELKAAGLANFEEGNPDSINPELALDEQADLLPYDKKYEFPREKLKLGKQLGAGAFGVVVKAFAQGILPYEEETTVAVKMVKQTADNEVMRALITELKIMVHLGQHLNVVNLLGAVTKNIVKREVMVIVEYCRFGNLQNFLIKHREYFVDQIVRDQDIIDPTILTRENRWSNDSGYEYYNSGKGDLRKSTGNSSNVNSKGYMRHSSVADYFPGGMDSANTEATLISRNTGGEDNLAMSNNSTQPAWRSNYKMDYKGPARTVTTSDLLCWCFQVARGMEYLASRKVLHGDLAARNILLCDDNVVKICDFGLARSIYKSDNYKKKGETPLPFKWLAIESISDQVFSTYSDVWSFGIVMWELFSLGKVPYPGMDADQGLYFKLKDGYRMEKPEYATQDIYDVMLQCWSAHPESRPLFDNLEKTLGKLLENGVAEHYIDLNEPYLQMNVQNFTGGQTDYLALMTSPDCQAPAAPNYVNTQMVPTSVTPPPPNYLTMSPTVNSPTGGGDSFDTRFQFPSLNSPTTANNLNASPTAKQRTKNPAIPEEIPMLKRSNQSINTDSETEANSLNSHNAEVDGHDTRPQPQPRDFKRNVNALNATNDNYVNVPSTIININTKDAVSNPGYVVVGNINETRT